MYFLANAFQLSANTITAIYKERWQIELFFKLFERRNLKTLLRGDPPEPRLLPLQPRLKLA